MQYPARRGRAYLILAFLLLIALLGTSALMTISSNLDPIAPFAPLAPFTTLVRDGQSQPSATATAIPILQPPALGSEATAFAAFFGAPTTEVAAGATAEFQTQTTGQPVDLRVEFGLGADRLERVVLIGISDPTLQGWPPATADTICAIFLPSDAQLRSFVHAPGQTEYIYSSASLAAFFSPAAFMSDNGQPSAPGTFSRLDQSAPGPASAVTSCILALGQHYQ